MPSLKPLIKEIDRILREELGAPVLRLRSA